MSGHTETVTCVAFAPDGSKLASGSEDKDVILWDTNTGQQRSILRGQPNDINALAFSPDGKTLAVGSGEPIYQFNKAKELRLWDLTTEQPRLIVSKLPGSATSVAFSPDGSLLAVAHADAQNQRYPGVATLWNLSSGQMVATLKGHKSMIWCVAFFTRRQDPGNSKPRRVGEALGSGYR